MNLKRNDKVGFARVVSIISAALALFYSAEKLSKLGLFFITKVVYNTTLIAQKGFAAL